MFKLHGMSGSITSDRYPIILSQFRTEFFNLQGVPLIKTTTYHRQSNGQTKTANKGLKTYLCGMCLKNCTLSIIQITNLHSTIQSTSFEVIYNKKNGSIYYTCQLPQFKELFYKGREIFGKLVFAKTSIFLL